MQPRPCPECQARHAAILGVGLLATLATATGLAQVVDPILVFGGTDCSTTQDIIACAGYPPAGLMLSAPVGAVAAALAAGAWGGTHG